MSKMSVSRRVALVVIICAVAAGGVVFGLGERPQDPTVVGMFTDANPLAVGNTVRASGVDVGKVQSVTLDQGVARVTMSVDSSVFPLHNDASLSIRPVNLLGEEYVDLNPGSASAPVVPGIPVIPTSRTGKDVSLQDVLNSLDDPTSTALALLVTGLGEGVHGQGQNLQNTLKALQPALTQVDQLGKVLNGQNGTLQSLLQQVQPVVNGLAANQGQNLDQLVGSTQQVLAAVASQRQALDQSLAQLPATLTAAAGTLAHLTGAAGSATSDLATVRPVTDQLTQISNEIGDVANAANPALAALNPVLDEAESLLKQARPVVDGLGPAAAQLSGAAQAARPIATTAINSLGNIMDFVKWWALSTNGSDGLSHYFRGIVVATPQALLNAVQGGVPLAGPGPVAPAPPSTGGLPPLPLPSLPLLPLTGDPSTPGITGLTQPQEQSMLGQLLGGL